ncbi:hypothetical protein [Actinoplanes siamensis]|uniref:hypothetical protein n=1 Tax=Actinoplanes siamensis TaxID=1223317 RepID=UPI001942C0D2|nr:hypothetical protein [Actinoplanes siamensis]
MIVGILVAVVLVVTNREQDGPDPGAARSVGAGSAQGGGPDRRDESEQADAAAARRMDALLTESIAGRRYLLEAIDQALACDTSAASRGMRAASQARTDLIAKAGDTDLAALPGGDDLKSGLIGFLRASYTADQAYLRWVRSADGCPSTGGAGFPAVERANAEARSRKTGFLADWNPVAERFGLPTRDVKSI